MPKKQRPPDAPLARRTILKGATLGVGAGLVSTSPPPIVVRNAQFSRCAGSARERLGELNPRTKEPRGLPGALRDSSIDPDPDRSSHQ
jgi:hypothetical protein